MTALASRLLAWAERTMAAREPDFIVGGKDNPYLLRWWIVPRNGLFNIYLHKFLRDDDDRALHDHPWPSLSFVLGGGYIEHTPGRQWARTPGALVVRRATSAHRVELFRDGDSPRAAISLFFTGPHIRRWGFHCPNGWVHWKVFVQETDHGAVGRGCGEP